LSGDASLVRICGRVSFKDGIEKELGNREMGRAVQGIYLAPRLIAGEERKCSGSDDHLVAGSTQYFYPASERTPFHTASCIVPVVCGLWVVREGR